MKYHLEFLLIAPVIVGCVSTTQVTAPDQYAEINDLGKELTATISLQSGSPDREYEGEFLTVERDSVRWVDPQTHLGQVDNTRNLRRIRFTRIGIGLAEGAAFGAIPGAVLAIKGLAYPDEGRLGSEVTAFFGGVLAAGGALIGAGIGAASGHKTVYVFPLDSSFTSRTGAALAEPATDPTFRGPPPIPFTAQDVVYGEWATHLLGGSFSLNYEHSLTRSLWIRVGYGAGKRDNVAGYGPLAMAVLILGKYNNKFELALGGSLSDRYDDLPQPITVGTEGTARSTHIGWQLNPAASIGYRYQPADGGLMFRAGLTISYYGGFPVEISAGYAF